MNEMLFTLAVLNTRRADDLTHETELRRRVAARALDSNDPAPTTATIVMQHAPHVTVIGPDRVRFA